MDPLTKQLLDSLNNRIDALRSEIPRLSASRDASYFFKKRELDMTIFQRDYYTDSRFSAAEKRRDNVAVDFYRDYKTRLTKERSSQLARYQHLFAKEKNFRKELYRFIDAGDEYSLHRAQRMTELAIKFAKERNLETVIPYLYNYNSLVRAKLFDFYSDYDLDELTHSDRNFQKVFMPLIESDSLELIENAGKLVENCYIYAASSHCVLDTAYFALQRNVVLTSIADYNERKGNNLALSNMEGSTILARLDTLNREGVYKWHDKIIVVGSIKPTASYMYVKKGEAIIDADHRLIEYIRVNRLAKVGKEIKMGYTFLIPYTVDGAPSDFHFNQSKMRYQYIACYSKIENGYFTKSISKFLPVMQFEFEVE